MIRHLGAVYAAEFRMGMINQFQYRFSVFFQILGFLIEPIVYLVVWRTVAEQAGPIGGYTVADFTAYYIVWTLVRSMNLALTPYVWDRWIQRGRVSEALLKPVNLIHRQIAVFAGFKVMWILAWVPIALFLSAVFRPSLSPSLLEVAVFCVAIWLGFVVRFMVLYLMGMISFWTTRASAMFEIMVAAEMLLSGRLVPLSVMPDWVERIANWLPFKWSFAYPIEVLIGKLSTEEVLLGLLAQIGWITALGLLFSAVWRRAIRRYSAVGA